MAYVVMAYVVMASVVMAYIVMAYVVMAYIVSSTGGIRQRPKKGDLTVKDPRSHDPASASARRRMAPRTSLWRLARPYLYGP